MKERKDLTWRLSSQTEDGRGRMVPFYANRGVQANIGKRTRGNFHPWKILLEFDMVSRRRRRRRRGQ